MNTAQLIADKLRHCGTFSLQAGYAMPYRGSRITFEPGRVLQERRNPQGQCASMIVQYRDGSTLTYTRRPNNEFTLGASK